MASSRSTPIQHNALKTTSRLRLLMPTVRPPHIHDPSSVLPLPQTTTTTPRSPRLRPTPTNRLIRSRSGSASDPVPVAAAVPPTTMPADTGSEWLGVPYKFEIVQEELQIDGYQMYAVEKWIVERTRPVIVLTVYTGDPSHKITVTALSPSSTLSLAEAEAEWESALHHLRRDGARPKETPSGTLHTTSLANFRSDFTIVHIPHGNFLAAKDQLYTNIGLLRMGCSGRSAVGLEDVSETTKDRFLSMYLLPDPSSTLPGSATKQKSPSSTKHKHHAYSLSLAHPNSVPLPGPSRLHRHNSLSPPRNTTSHDSKHQPHPKSKDRSLFNATVLELVKLIQAALAIAGMFPLQKIPHSHSHHHHHHHHHEHGVGVVEMDGLLCDVTVEGIQKWVSEVGESGVGVEPMERVADPSVVSALLSLVLVTRNKLAAIGYSHAVPKDPFLHPQEFCATLIAYAQSTSPTPASMQASSTSLSISSPFHSPHTPFHIPHMHTPFIGSPASPIITTGGNGASPAAPTVYLTLSLITSINAAFVKSRSSDPRKMHRVLFNKLDDLATDKSGGEKGYHDGSGSGGGGGGGGGRLLGDLASGLGLSGGGAMGAGGLLEPTSDLRELVRVLVPGEKGREKDRDLGEERWEGRRTAWSLKALWSGRVASVVRMRAREREKHIRKGEVERDKSGIWSDGDSDGAKTSEDENDSFGGIPWSGRMQKKIESWTKLSRTNKRSLDLPRGGPSGNGRLVAPPMSNESSSSSHARKGAAAASALLPPVISRDAPDEEDLLSSGQVSPISGAPFILGAAGDSSANFTNNDTRDHNASARGSISDYDKRVNAFNKNRPLPAGKGGWGNRVTSWSHPISARNILLDEDEVRDHDGSGRSSHSGTRARAWSRVWRDSFGADGEEVWVTVSGDEGAGDVERRRRLFRHCARRRHSFHDLSSFDYVRVLSPERMRIDVALSGQLLVMLRREEHLENVLACLEAITASLSSTNASLREDYLAHQDGLYNLGARTQAIAQIEAERIKADTTTQERNSLCYESELFRVDELWHMASPSRQKVLDLREKVFGTGGRRLPTGVRGSHGRFNRVQWTLDGGERLVDLMGRTESEAEEVASLEARGVSIPLEEEEEDVVDHPGIKPMWLLRFFTSWGARWSAKKEEPPKEPSAEPRQDKAKATLADTDATAAPANGHRIADPSL